MRHALTILLLSASVAFGQLTNATLDGVTNATINSVLDNDAAATRAALGLGTAATATTSTDGGPNLLPIFDANAILRLGPANATNGTLSTGGTLRIPDRQEIQWEDSTGSVKANLYLQGNHSNGAELLANLQRGCIYWDHGIQLGQAGTARSKQFLYFQSLGAADAGDPVREGVPVMWDGEAWIGGARTQTMAALQWIPSSTTAQKGELQFSFFGSGYTPYDYLGKVSGIPSVNQSLSIADDGLRLKASGSKLTFFDATTLSSTGDIQDMIDASNVPRTGYVELVAGEATITDASITGYTEILLSHKVAGGTLGHLSIVKDYGVGFDIVSSSATDTSTVSYLMAEGTVSDVAAPAITRTVGSDALAAATDFNTGDTLTATGGVGTRQWKANGANISGETAATYVVSPAYVGQSITCERGGVASNALVSWHPDDESGYYADYRNDAGLYQTAGGIAATAHADPVGQWQDQSGNARHIANATAGERPTLDSTTYAGYPFMLFDGSDDYLRVDVTHTLPQTAFIVAETIAVASSKRLFSTGEASDRMLVTPLTGDEIQNGGGTPATTDPNNLWPVNTRGIVTARTTSTNHYIRINGGTEYASGACTPGAGSRILVGGIPGAGGDHNCRVFGVLFYAATLDADAQPRVRKYLKAKYGTP